MPEIEEATHCYNGTSERVCHQHQQVVQIFKVRTPPDRSRVPILIEAKLYRIKGTLTLLPKTSLRQVTDKSENPSPQPLPQSEAEACFLKAIEIAQRQQAKSLELRATTSLARLWQQQDKREEARQLLAEIYSWFTEGFDTKDLQEAKALLEALS